MYALFFSSHYWGEFVKGGESAPAELLGRNAVGFEVVHEVERLITFQLADGLVNGLVNTRVGFGKVEQVGRIAMAEHGEVVAREDMVPMQVVVVTQHVEMVPSVCPALNALQPFLGYTAVHAVPCHHLLVGCSLVGVRKDALLSSFDLYNVKL